MMIPIHRIPKLDSESSFEQVLSAELQNRRKISLWEQLEGMHSHTKNEDALSITLDWAMEIRNTQGISWSESIDIAMTLYFG